MEQGVGYNRQSQFADVVLRILFHSQFGVYSRSHTHFEAPLMVVALGSNSDKNNKSEIVCAADYSDEPYLMLNRDFSLMGQDNRISAFDLLDFEM
ncbi:hypothetical protein AKJ16_DCAP20930 [Drosera capensis]